MCKVLQCPHFYSIGSILRLCMNGRFPCDCENCDCPDKKYVEITTTSASYISECNLKDK